MKFDNDTIGKVCRLIRWHDLRPTPEMADVRKAMNVIGEDIFPMWMEVQYADNQAKSDYRRLGKKSPVQGGGAEKSWGGDHQGGTVRFPEKLAVTGSDLIAAGMKPGKEIGNTLNALLELVLENPEKNTKQTLLACAFTGNQN